jgi:anhydro-N-acetylmuramic acid kinase
MKWTGVIGLMSGTSLDGLDCCFVEFAWADGKYLFRNLQTKAIPYTAALRDQLRTAFDASPEDLKKRDQEYGAYLADEVNRFITAFSLQGKVALIASHGHTVFHQPKQGITVQIGSGEVLHQNTGIDVINDFRITDVGLGGQGAPLVPVGDHYLFQEYDACLNLGGFSNISFVNNGRRIAFDISPCNLPINMLMQRYYQLDFDAGGKIASSGKKIPDLFDQLEELPFYRLPGPKSLGFEWLRNDFMPVVDRFANRLPQDIIHTVSEHVAHRVSAVFNQYKLPSVLVTGGGAYNNFIRERISDLSGSQVIIPTRDLVEFKEALIFAFLGYLNLNNTVNTFKSVTGASRDSIGGKRHFSH